MGLQDAFNLGWTLAAEVRGWAPPGLLETYHTERHAAGARVLLNTRAQVALADPADRFDPLRALFAELAPMEPVRRRFAETVTGVGNRYDIAAGNSHQFLGRHVPNLALETAQGPAKLSVLLHFGRGLLLDLADRPDLRATATGWADRVDTVLAKCATGQGADACLIRPDGYAVWVAPGGSQD